MPELPELQAHAERLNDLIGGATINSFKPITFTALKTFTPDPALTHGSRVERVGRRGKYLLVHTDTDPEPITFVVHLMQGGRLEPDAKQAAKPRGGIARWTFTNDTALLLTEPGSERKAGVWLCVGDPNTSTPLSELGPDADTLDRIRLTELLRAHSMRLHTWLRDQHIVAGMGRRLANEVCHRAKLSPFASTAKLSDEQIDALAAAITSCIADTLTEERERTKLSKSAERTSAVHNRVGEPCHTCGTTIASVEYRAYTVAYCPNCQTGGKVLADNTTSKFLK